MVAEIVHEHGTVDVTDMARDLREVRCVLRGNMSNLPGTLDIEVGYGKGSGGPGRGFDHLDYMATLRKLSQGLSQYAAAYEVEYMTDGAQN